MRALQRILRHRRVLLKRWHQRRSRHWAAPPPASSAAPPVAGRLIAVRVILALGLLIVVGRLFVLQVLRHEQYSEMASVQQERRVTIGAVRGPILDREGRVLVRTLTARTLVAHPSRIADAALAAKTLAPIIGRHERELTALLSSRDRLVELDAQVDAGEAAALGELRLKGVEIVEAGRRVKLFDCDLLGTLNHEGRGNEGTECAMEEYLRGVDGWDTRFSDGGGALRTRHGAPMRPATHGSSVVLTIDSNLQWRVERALEEAVTAHDARGGSAVLVEVATGELLAIAGQTRGGLGVGRRVKRLSAIEDAYEPGSTFKLVTFAAAHDLDLIDDDSVFFAENGRANFGSCWIRDVKKMGWLCAADVLAQSSNIATAKIGQLVGARELYAAAKRLGFGCKTHLDLPGEVAGILHPVSEWSGRSVPTVAIGQEVGVTSLQLALAYACVASGGELRRARLVRQVIAADGTVRMQTEPEVVRRAMSRTTAETLTRYLVRAVESGTGKRAAIPGVLVAGKTGTAQKARKGGRGYDPDKYVASFAGFFPADAPRFALAITIDEPEDAHYGGEVAAPVFHQIALAVLGPGNRMDGLRTLEGGKPLAPRLLTVPDVRLMTAEAAIETLVSAGLEATVGMTGDRVLIQEPDPGSLVPARTVVHLGREPEVEPLVPDLHGLSLREALRKLRGVGVVARVEGTGRVEAQVPEAGTVIAPGLVCQLTLTCGKSGWRLPTAEPKRLAASSGEPALLASASTSGR